MDQVLIAQVKHRPGFNGISLRYVFMASQSCLMLFVQQEELFVVSKSELLVINIGWCYKFPNQI